MITEDRRLVMMVMWVLMWAMMAMASATELVVRATEQVEWKDTRVYGKVRVEYGGEILIKNSGGAPEDVLKTYGYMEIVGNDVELLQGGRISASKAKFLGPPRPEVGENHGGIGGSYGGRGGAPEPDARLAPRGTVEGADIERGGSGGDGPGGWRLGREAGGSLIIRGENVTGGTERISRRTRMTVRSPRSTLEVAGGVAEES